jgi:galactokinase
MDPIPFSIASAIVAALVGAVAVLFKMSDYHRSKAEKNCAERVQKLEEKVNEMDREYKKSVVAELKKSELRELAEQARAQRFADIVQTNNRCIAEVCGVMNSTKIIVEHAARIMGKIQTASEILSISQSFSDIKREDAV